MFSILTIIATVVALTIALPLQDRNEKRALHTAISNNFQDPGLLEVDGTYYAYGGINRNPVPINVLTASSVNFASFDVHNDYDALPYAGSWAADPPHVWAPDVNRLDNGKFIMYYSASLASDPSFHCVGAAMADAPLGPFNPQAEPIFCDLSAGGAIDSDGWRDPKSGKQYIVYKIDGNTIGNGGDCKNTIDPIAPTPLMIQEVSIEDGFTKIGGSQQLLINNEGDGANIEAPALTYHPETDTYILFFNSHCYLTSKYTINYASSKGSIFGPYTRHNDAPFLATGDTAASVYAPGGIDLTSDGTRAIFHGDINMGWVNNDGSKRVRGVYSIALDFQLNKNGDAVSSVRPGAFIS